MSIENEVCYKEKPNKQYMDYSDILDRTHIKKEITTILKSFDERCGDIQYKKGIYIFGSPGSGKTNFVVKLLEELNYDTIKYDAGDVRNKTLIDNTWFLVVLNSFCSSQHRYTLDGQSFL